MSQRQIRRVRSRLTGTGDVLRVPSLAGVPGAQLSRPGHLALAGALAPTFVGSQLPCAHSLASPSFSARGPHREGAPALLASCRVLLATVRPAESTASGSWLWSVRGGSLGPSRAPFDLGVGMQGQAAGGRRPLGPRSLGADGPLFLLTSPVYLLVPSESKKIQVQTSETPLASKAVK